MKQFDECVDLLKKILDREKCKDAIVANRLQAAGIIKGTPPNLEFACGLYEQYFKGKL